MGEVVFQKLSGKSILMVSVLVLFFAKEANLLANTINISKEQLQSILNELPSSETVPITGEEWTEGMVEAFGGMSIDKELFDFIRSTLPEGKVLLELGSGWTSGQFSQYYTVYSIEHNFWWLGKYNTNYIHVPIKNKWYNPDILRKKIPDNYDLILVDGPPGFSGSATNRHGFYTYLDLFKTDLTIIFDDVDRKAEYELMIRVGQKLQRNIVILNSDKSHKKFGVILYEETI